MTPLLIFAFLLLAAASAYAVRSERRVRQASLASAAIGGTVVFGAALSGLLGRWTPAVDGWWHADAFTWMLVGLIAFVYVAAAAVSYRYVGVERHEGALALPQVRLYFCLLHLFVLTMLAAALADNLGVLWMSLEGTTLATTMLVAMYRKDASIEAAWKYIILCSIGISLGLLGMLMFVHAAALGAGLSPEEALSLSALRAHASFFDPSLVRWAFIFVFIGLGTKVGFVPMHAWLPDAHSKTPSPISAMLSGILLNVAFAAILRFKTVADAALGGGEWTEGLFLAFGLLSAVVAALFLLQQRNYKRMLAYSSVEHMGIMAFAVGLGPVGLAAALVHTVGHTLVKPMLFFGAGEFLLAYKSTHIEDVREARRRLPITSTLFLFGLLLILAVPPSALFSSEFLAIGAGLQVHPWLSLLLLAALSVIALGMLRSVAAMLYGKAATTTEAAPERFNLTHGVMILQLCAALAFGAFALTPTAMRFFSGIAQSLTAL
ncbi:MAG TPA: proton-conducting transporter membrane subunit [Patescibacteria group bacterium]|nr:proton-conducting transporter membrane subunit [Patescibacteria group bacterium]